MGMFDDITCDYPLPDNPNLVRDFQTKDLDCCLDHFRVTDEGRLLRNVYDLRRLRKKKGESIFPMFTRVDKGWEDTGYHGMLMFYTYDDGARLEYRAKFTDGFLIDVERIARGES